MEFHMKLENYIDGMLNGNLSELVDKEAKSNQLVAQAVIAAYIGDMESVTSALSSGIKVNATAQGKYLKSVSLKENIKNPIAENVSKVVGKNVTDNESFIPLHLDTFTCLASAVLGEQEDMILFLLNNGAEINAKCNIASVESTNKDKVKIQIYDCSIFMLSVIVGNKDITKLLINHAKEKNILKQNIMNQAIIASSMPAELGYFNMNKFLSTFSGTKLDVFDVSHALGDAEMFKLIFSSIRPSIEWLCLNTISEFLVEDQKIFLDIILDRLKESYEAKAISEYLITNMTLVLAIKKGLSVNPLLDLLDVEQCELHYSFPSEFGFFDTEYKSLLHVAVEYGREGNVKELLDKRVNPNILDGKKNTPLHIVLRTPPYAESLWMALAAAGAKLNIKNREGKTCLDLCTNEFMKKKIIDEFEKQDEATKKKVVLSPVISAQTSQTIFNQYGEHSVVPYAKELMPNLSLDDNEPHSNRLLMNI